MLTIKKHITQNDLNINEYDQFFLGYKLRVNNIEELQKHSQTLLDTQKIDQKDAESFLKYKFYIEGHDTPVIFRMHPTCVMSKNLVIITLLHSIKVKSDEWQKQKKKITDIYSSLIDVYKKKYPKYLQHKTELPSNRPKESRIKSHTDSLTHFINNKYHVSILLSVTELSENNMAYIKISYLPSPIVLSNINDFINKSSKSISLSRPKNNYLKAKETSRDI